MNTSARLIAALALLVAGATPALADEAADRNAILALLRISFDKPDARLTVEPVVIEDNYAIADWTQGEMGGRGLLRRDPKGWVLILCSGDGLKSAELVSQAGAAKKLATRLTGKLAAAESKLEARRIAQLAKFEGVMMVEGGHHGHGDQGHDHHAAQ